MLLLPGQPTFSQWLALPPPTAQRSNYVVRPGSCDVMEAVTDSELDEYLESGEYDERLDEIEEQELSINPSLSSDFLYLPVSMHLA